MATNNPTSIVHRMLEDHKRASTVPHRPIMETVMGMDYRRTTVQFRRIAGEGIVPRAVRFREGAWTEGILPRHPAELR